MSERFDYACWQLQVKGNPEPLRKELARLAQTSTGKQVIHAQALLDEFDGPAGGEGRGAGGPAAE